jgi:hypothetical protein
MNFEQFFNQVKRSKLQIPFQSDSTRRGYLLDNEALFQLPFISLIILLMAKDKRKPFVSETGQLVGESIEASILGFKGSSQHLGWSTNLRVRTVKAIGFLEVAGLIEIDNRKSRIRSTTLGSKVINKALSRDDDLAYNLSKVSRAYRNICVSRKLDMELE